MKPNLLCIVPPYPITSPPAGAAALLGYLKANGCHDFDFVDLRLWVPYTYAPTLRAVGAFGESYVMDVPDLPLVLSFLRAFERGEPLVPAMDELFERYCIERAIHPVSLHAYLRSMDRFLEGAVERLGEPRFVGFSVWTSNFLPTLMAAAHLKRRRKPPFIIAGGPQVTESVHSARLGLKSGLFDAVAQGEGEETLLRTYEAVMSGGRPSAPIPGTMMYDPATNSFPSAERKLLRLPELPLPSFDEMQLRAYEPIVKGLKILPYQLSRGCTDKCSFCSEWVFWKHFRLGSMQGAIEQIRELKARYGLDAIWFTDSLLNGKKERLLDFAEGLLKSDLEILWGGFMRADMDKPTAELLHRAGLRSTFLGIESLSNETLAAMNKRRTEADNLRALQALLGTGIDVAAGLIPGFPGDTRERFLATARALGELQRDFPNLRVNVEPFILSPGQPISRMLDKVGLTPSSWPQEVLDIAPGYVDITQNILCSVEGRNQAMERAGQLRVALAMSSVGGRKADWFGYPKEESLPSDAFLFTHLFDDWYLGRVKTEGSLVYGVLVDLGEKSQLEALGGQRMSLEEARERRLALTERSAYRAMLEQLEAGHLVPGSRERPRITSHTYAQPEGEDALSLSPFTLARALRLDGEETVLLVHAVTLARTLLPAHKRAVVELLHEAPRPYDKLVEHLTLDAELDEDDVRGTLRMLIEFGLVVVGRVREEDSPVGAFARGSEAHVQEVVS